MKFTIRIVMVEKGKADVEEMVTVEAKDEQKAMRLAQVHMTLSPRGQLLRFFNGTKELLDERW